MTTKRKAQWKNASVSSIIMRGADTEIIDLVKNHTCPKCGEEYPCGEAFCGSVVGKCVHPKEWFCGECFDDYNYD